MPVGQQIDGILDLEGEVEIFAGNPKNEADWHTDFQENFTV